MIAEATILSAVRLLQDAAPEATVMLFGSYARGNANEKSDLDLLVVKPWIGHRRMETVLLRAVVRRVGVPVDVLLADQETFARWRGTPGMIKYLPQSEGRWFPAIDFGISIAQFRAGQLYGRATLTELRYSIAAS